MIVFDQIVQCIAGGFGVVFKSLSAAWSVYQSINGLSDQILAVLFGVPVVVISAFGILLGILKLIKKLSTR